MKRLAIVLAAYFIGVGSALGVVAASQTYEYRLLPAGPEYRRMIEQEGWQPMQANEIIYLRRPRLRLP